MGATRPTATTLAAAGRARNGRVELTLSPLIAPAR
jgi:outer membrane protein OmpA-like peptidoglycan-associated protein